MSKFPPSISALTYFSKKNTTRTVRRYWVVGTVSETYNDEDKCEYIRSDIHDSIMNFKEKLINELLGEIHKTNPNYEIKTKCELNKSD